MANVYDAFFILQFLVFIVIILLKLYNIMSLGKIYEIKMVFLTFIVSLIAYAIGFISLMANPETLIYLMLFQLETWLLILSIVLLFGELFFFLAATTKLPMTAQFSKEEA